MASERKDRERLSDAELARQEAIKNAVGTWVSMAAALAFSWALLNRDELPRIWARIHGRLWPAPADPHAGQVAEFRRDIADISRGTPGPADTRVKGLYEHG